MDRQGRTDGQRSAARWAEGSVVARTPATSANLGPGFDSLGLALGLHDEVQARVIEDGLAIKVTGMGEQTAQHGEGHLVVRAMRAAFELLGEQPPGLELRCVNTIPHGFGLGSSAAAIVAGILSARALYGAGPGAELLTDEAVLRLAADIEGHADNVAACLSGGLTVAWGVPPRCTRLEPVPGLTPVLCVPTVPMATEAARQVLPATVPHADAATNAARAALLVAALSEPGVAADAGVLLEATQDLLHQPYRAGAMPVTAELIGALRAADVPAVVSGAGPAVLALLLTGVTAAADVVADLAAASGRDWTVQVMGIDLDGATVRP